MKNVLSWFASTHTDVAGEHAGQSHIKWSDTIIAWVVIGLVIFFITISAVNADRQPPLTPEQYQDARENDPRW